MLFIRSPFVVMVAVWQTGVAVSLPVESHGVRDLSLQDILRECAGTNRVNCGNIGGVHIGQGAETGLGDACVVDSGNVGGVPLKPAGSAPRPGSEGANPQPGQCVDCGHVGGNFVNTVPFDDDDN